MESAEIDVESNLVSVTTFKDTRNEIAYEEQMKELKGKRSVAERENPYGPAVKTLDEKIEKLTKKINDDEEDNSEKNTGVGFAIFRRQSVATFVRNNDKKWRQLPSVDAIDGASSVYATNADIESEIIW